MQMDVGRELPCKVGLISVGRILCFLAFWILLCFLLWTLKRFLHGVRFSYQKSGFLAKVQRNGFLPKHGILYSDFALCKLLASRLKCVFIVRWFDTLLTLLLNSRFLSISWWDF